VGSSFNSPMNHKAQRYGLIFIYAVLYVAYISLFSKRLQTWDWNVPGHCYNGMNDSFFGKNGHPTIDRQWVGLLSAYVFFSLSLAIGVAMDLIRRYFSPYVVLFAALMGPIHAYSIFSLRRYNETFLTSGITEQQWGFGQTVSMILLGTNVIVLVNGIQGEFSCALTSLFHQGLKKSKLMLFVRLSRMED
jgi:hypothetical protein